MFGQTRNHRLSADCRNFLLDYLAKNGPAQSAVSNRMRTWNPQAALFLLAQFRKNGLRYTDRSDVGPFDVFRTLRHTQFRQMSFWHVPNVDGCFQGPDLYRSAPMGVSPVVRPVAEIPKGSVVFWDGNSMVHQPVCHEISLFIWSSTQPFCIFSQWRLNFFSIYPPFLGNGSRKAFVWDFSKGMVGSRVVFEVWRNPWCWSVVLCQRLLCREPWQKRSGVQGVVATQQPKRSREVPLVKLQDLTQIVTNYFVCIKLACKIMPPRYQCLVTFFSMSWYIDKNVNHERNTLVDWWI